MGVFEKRDLPLIPLILATLAWGVLWGSGAIGNSAANLIGYGIVIAAVFWLVTSGRDQTGFGRKQRH